MHNFIVNFDKILDICKQFAGNRVNNKGNVPRCGVVPKFSDLEVIALSLTAEVFGYDSENLLFKILGESVEKFPNLISRRQYNLRRKLTALLAEKIRKDIAREIDGGESVFIIDPNLSRSAKWQEPGGVMHSYDMTAANVHDIRYLDDAKWEYRNSLMFGDKGYLSTEIRQSLFDVANITLEVPYRLNQKDWRPPSEAYKRFRKRIETVFSQGGFYKFALSKI